MVPDQRMLQHAQSCGTATLLPRAAQLLCARCSRQLHSVSAVASLEPVRASRLPQETAPRPNSAQRTSGQDRQQTITQSEGFLAGQHTSFTSIGLSREVASALDAAGFKRPSGVQELAAAPITEGKDVALSAETGSGKTLAYLTPILSELLAGAPASPSLDDQHQGALILCPNAALCDQVVSVASSLKGANGKPLVRAARASAQQPPGRVPPGIVVATPAGLLSATQGGGFWTSRGLLAGMRHVVLDECDMLLTGGFEAPTRLILNMLKELDRARMVTAVCSDLSISEDEFRSLPLLMRRTGLAGGAAAMQGGGYTRAMIRSKPAPPPDAAEASPDAIWEAASSSSPSSSSSQDPDSGTSTETSSSEASGSGAASSDPSGGGSSSYGMYRPPGVSSSPPGSTSQPGSTKGRSGSGDARQPYWRRQYIFCAATMPSGGGDRKDKSITKEVTDIAPDAVWLQGRQLHRALSGVQHRWVPVRDQQDRRAAIQEAVKADRKGRTLVFTGNVASANQVAQELREAGLQPLLYHRDVPAHVREDVLLHMADRPGSVMVCTDAAARGLDIANISHVLQADFASSAIDFLHRAGRTGRAGKPGLVTSLYTEDQAPLAEAIRGEVEAGRPIEGTFSRNRSFKAKFKKYGEYVPRGQVHQNTRV